MQLIAQYARPQVEASRQDQPEPEEPVDLDPAIRSPAEVEQPLLRVEEVQAVDKDVRNDSVVFLPATAVSLPIVNVPLDHEESQLAIFDPNAAWSQNQWLGLGFGIGTLIVALVIAFFCWKVSLTTLLYLKDYH